MFDKLISLIAPYNCLMCSSEGDLLCSQCFDNAIDPIPSRCYKCARLTDNFAVCQSCKRSSYLKSVYTVTTLDGPPKQLLYGLKFTRTKQASTTICRFLDELVPELPHGATITFVPTATSRIRLRGYDQVELIAKKFAKCRGLTFTPLLRRVGQSMQVGATRTERSKQATKSYVYSGKKVDTRRPVLIVDDILTTGATLEACTKQLRQAGFKNISALVYAQK